MKITALRIGHFGKLHNVLIEPGDGLNLVMGDNESGKSTVVAFISAMLFGFDRGRGRAGREDMYNRYLPWDTPGAYQGSLDFTHEGRSYRITRVFYNKEKSCVFTDLDTGRRLDVPGETITALIPQLTRHAWNNTVSMGQKALRYADDFGDEVRNHIANLAMTGSGQVDVANALALLDARRKSAKKASGGRVASDVLRDRLQGLRRDEEEAIKLENELNGKKEQTKQLDVRIASLESRIPDVEEYAGEWNRCMERVDNALVRLKAVENRQSDCAEKPDSVEKTDCGEKPVAPIRNAGIMILAAGILTALLSGGKSAAGVGIGAVAIMVGLVCLLMSIIRSRENRILSSKLKNGTENAETEATDLTDRDAEWNTELAEYDNARAALEKAASQLSEATKKRDGIYEKISDAERGKTALYGDIDKLEWQLGELGDIASMIDECEGELHRIEIEEQAERIDAEAVKLATDTIAALADELHDSFANDFNGILSEEVSLATDGVYGNARISPNFETEVMAGLDYVRAEQLSGGTAEQIYLAFRFAAARLMFDGIEVPLLLDESFAYSDDARLRAVLSAITDRDGQVFVFACSSRERNVLNELGAQYHTIMM